MLAGASVNTRHALLLQGHSERVADTARSHDTTQPATQFSTALRVCPDIGGPQSQPHAVVARTKAQATSDNDGSDSDIVCEDDYMSHHNRITYARGTAASATSAGASDQARHVNNCQGLVVTRDEPVGRRRNDAPTGSKVACQMPPHTSSGVWKGPGSKHAAKVGGPFAEFALAGIPHTLPQGAKRHAAGLMDIPLTNHALRENNQRRAACVLVALLPRETAPIVLSIPQRRLDSLGTEAVAKLLVDNLASHGASSLSNASSVLGRLLTFAADTFPSDHELDGGHVKEWLDSIHVSSAISRGITWIRDYTGLDLPARGASAKRQGRSSGTLRRNDKESFSLVYMMGLEFLARHGETQYIRGHAAALYFLAQHALRAEQAAAFVINGYVEHVYGSETFVITCGAILNDKNPNPAKCGPRPCFGCTDALAGGDGVRTALADMLLGREGVRCLMLDTDSADGGCAGATTWLSAPLKGTRLQNAIRGISSILRLPDEYARTLHGHSGKRWVPNVCTASPALTSGDAHEAARFSGSTAQKSDLRPTEAMMQTHNARISLMPDIYANKANLAAVFDAICKIQIAIRGAADHARRDPSLIFLDERGWGNKGPFQLPLPAYPSPATDDTLVLVPEQNLEPALMLTLDATASTGRIPASPHAVQLTAVPHTPSVALALPLPRRSPRVSSKTHPAPVL